MTFAQETHVFEEWVSTSGTQDFYIHGKSVTDAAGSVYQVGATLNDIGGYDAIISKHDRSGQELWTEIFNPSTTGDDTFIDIILTSSGDVVATGASRNSSETASDVFTVQLNGGTGNTDWQDSYSYSGSIYNIGSALALDGSDNVYVTGITSNFTTLSDVLVMKYNSTGSLQWANSEDVNGMEDGAVKLAYNSGKLTASGATQVLADKYRYLVMEFDAFDGSLINSFEGSDDVTSVDQVQDLVVDDAGNIYITGYAGATGEGYNMYTVKLNDELNILWEDSYNHSGSNHDRGYGIALDNSGNVIVTGCSDVSEGNTQFTTLKYNSTGTLQWVKADDISAGADTARAVITDANDNIYITGSFSNGSNQDVKTIKYSPAGTQLWAIDYNGQANGDEYVLDITLDEDDVLVCTQTWTGSAYKYAAIKYSQLEYTDLSFSSSEEVNPLAFLKNNGQLRDSSGSGHPEVKYMSKYGQSLSFYKDDGFDWMVRSYHNDSTVNDTVHKVAFDFVNPTSEVKVRPYQKADYFENHYIPQGMQKYERLPVYGKLLYSEVWDDIDLETCLIGDKELRFTVNKGGDVSDIKIAQTGADSIVKNNDGTIGVHFFNGEIVIPRVRAYQRNSNDDLVELSWQPALVKTGSVISLDSIGSYNANKSLILRFAKAGGDIAETPGFCHSTYFGSLSTDLVFGSTVDNSDNLAICGVSGNTSLYEDGNGIVQIASNGNVAGQSFVQKFDSDFVPLFLSIVNGNGSLALLQIEHSDDLYYAVGETSANNVPTANSIGADFFDDTNAIPSKGYISGFDEISGTLLYSSYFGAESLASVGWSEGNSILDVGFDSNNNMYIVGGAVMSPNTDFPLENNISAPYFEDSNTGVTGFIARFNSNFELDWCTQFGANESRLLSLDISSDDRLAIAGRFEGSTSFIPSIAGTVQDLTIGGNSDWFAAVFNTSGGLDWGTFEGSNDDEEGDYGTYGVRVEFGGEIGDDDDALYLAANLKSVDGITFLDPGNGAYFNDSDNGISSSNENNYAFIAKYRPGGSFDPIWRSLVMDGNRENKIYDLLYHSGAIHLVGYTADESLNLVQEVSSVYSADANPSFPNFSTSEEGYYIKFATINNAMLHSTYFGGEQSDEIRCISANSNDEVFGFGNSKSLYNSSQIGIPVADNDIAGRWYQENYVSSGQTDDVFGFKFCPGQILSTDDERTKSVEELVVYPNPSIDGSIWVDVPNTCHSPLEAAVYDMTGKVVYQNKLNLNDQGTATSLNLELSPGSYILSIRGCNEVYKNKLVILD